MNITATEKALKQCALITLQGNGIGPQQLESFIKGKQIEVSGETGALLIENDLAQEVTNGHNDLHE